MSQRARKSLTCQLHGQVLALAPPPPTSSPFSASTPEAPPSVPTGSLQEAANRGLNPQGLYFHEELQSLLGSRGCDAPLARVRQLQDLFSVVKFVCTDIEEESVLNFTLSPTVLPCKLPSQLY